MNRYLLSLSAVCCAALAALPATAQQGSDIADLEMLHGWRMSDGHHMTAMQITMPKGWHTYWRSPGEVGIPPQFSWAGSQNVAAVSLHWPVPQTFRQNGFTSVGYEDSLVLPIEVVAKGKGPIHLRGEATFGVCDEICVPVTLPFAVNLTEAASQPHRGIEAALSDRPIGRQQAQVSEVDCALSPARGGLRLRASVTMPPLGNDELAVVELPDATVWVSGGATVRDGRTVTTETDLIPINTEGFSVNRSDIRITVIGGGRAVDIRGCG